MLFDMVEEQEVSQVHVENESPAQHEVKHEVAPISKHGVQRAINGGINAVNFFDDKQLVAAENFLTKIMRSDKGGIKSVNDGLAVLMRAQDLQLPFSTCIEHIHVINGKTGVDIHIVKALLSRAGCTWRCLKDYQPLYEYTDGINVYIDGSFPEYVVRCKSQKEAEEKTKNDIASNISDNVIKESLNQNPEVKESNESIKPKIDPEAINDLLNGNYKYLQLVKKCKDLGIDVAKKKKEEIFKILKSYL